MILAIDPSINHTGWAILDPDKNVDAGEGLESYGCIHTKGDDIANKVSVLRVKLIEILKSVSIDLAIIEQPMSFTYERSKRYGKSQNRKSIALNNIAVGAIVVTIEQFVDQVVMVHPQQWKGNQRKIVTRYVVNQTFGLDLKQSDTIDAIGIGRWWILNQRFEKLMATKWKTQS